MWDNIEGPSKGGFYTIFRRFEVTFTQKVGDVWHRGERFINPAGRKRLWVSEIHGRIIYREGIVKGVLITNAQSGLQFLEPRRPRRH